MSLILMRKISICIVLGRLRAMLRMLISFCRFLFGQYLAIVLIKTDFTTPESRMLFRRVDILL